MNLIKSEGLRAVLVIVGEEKFIIVYIHRVNKDIDDLLLKAMVVNVSVLESTDPFDDFFF